MTKVVINTCYGGFGLSQKAYKFIGLEWDGYGYDFKYNDRDDPKLVECVEKLGKEANGEGAELTVVEVNEKYWTINDYDGVESIIASDSPLVHY